MSDRSGWTPERRARVEKVERDIESNPAYRMMLFD